MTVTLSFRADESLAKALDAEAVQSGITRSDLLNQAVRGHLYRLRCQRDAELYAQQPLTTAEVSEWPNEEWLNDDTDWTKVFSK